jgi:uncharacterized protein (DUF58 family)
VRRRTPGPPVADADEGSGSLLAKVHARASIPAHRRALGLVEGEYGSIHAGRSLDFDDLREYVIGDDIRDVDWKATARTGRPLIKRYVATRQQSVLLVVDTGRSMAGLAEPTTTKRMLAVSAAGIIGQLAMRHGDIVGLAAGPTPHWSGSTPTARRLRHGAPRVRNEHGVRFLAPSTGDLHLERMLRAVYDAIDVDGPSSDLVGLLEFVRERIRRRMIVVLVIDDVELAAAEVDVLRRLAVQHELLCCTVSDLALTDPAVPGRALRVLGPSASVAPFLNESPALDADIGERTRRRQDANRSALARLGITSCHLDREATVLSSIVLMLARHRYATPRRARR